MSISKSGKQSTEESKTVGGKSSLDKKYIYEELGFDRDPSANRSSALELDAALKAELDSLDLVARFINKKQFRADGFHPRNWKPYKPRTSKSTMPKSADGYIEFQDLILAVKPREWNEARKRELAQKNGRLANTQKVMADKMRQEVEASGGAAGGVTEGYDD